MLWNTSTRSILFVRRNATPRFWRMRKRERWIRLRPTSNRGSRSYSMQTPRRPLGCPMQVLRRSLRPDRSHSWRRGVIRRRAKRLWRHWSVCAGPRAQCRGAGSRLDVAEAVCRVHVERVDQGSQYSRGDRLRMRPRESSLRKNLQRLLQNIGTAGAVGSGNSRTQIAHADPLS